MFYRRGWRAWTSVFCFHVRARCITAPLTVQLYDMSGSPKSQVYNHPFQSFPRVIIRDCANRLAVRMDPLHPLYTEVENISPYPMKESSYKENIIKSTLISAGNKPKITLLVYG